MYARGQYCHLGLRLKVTLKWGTIFGYGTTCQVASVYMLRVGQGVPMLLSSAAGFHSTIREGLSQVEFHTARQ